MSMLFAVLFFTGHWYRPYEAKHINDRLQEELEEFERRLGAELCGNSAVSHKQTLIQQAHVTVIHPQIKAWPGVLTLFFLFGSDAFDFEYGTLVLRIDQGLDVSHLVEAEGQYEDSCRWCAFIYRKSCISTTTFVYEALFEQAAQSRVMWKDEMQRQEVALKEQHEINIDTVML